MIGKITQRLIKMSDTLDQKSRFQKNVRAIGTIGLKLKHSENLSTEEQKWLSEALLKIYFGDYVNLSDALGIESPDGTTIKSISDFDRRKIAIEEISARHPPKKIPFSKALDAASKKMGITTNELRKQTKKYYPTGTKDKPISETIVEIAKILDYTPESLETVWKDPENNIFKGNNSWSDLDRLLKKEFFK